MKDITEMTETEFREDQARKRAVDDATAELLQAVRRRAAQTDEARKDALRSLGSFVVECKPFGFTVDNDYYEDGDETAPLMSEGFLYPLLGKEDARSVLARWREVLESCGLTKGALEQ